MLYVFLEERTVTKDPSCSQEITDIDDTGKSYKQRALDAEAALTEYKERTSDEISAHQKTLEETERLEKEIAQVQKSENNDVVSHWLRPPSQRSNLVLKEHNDVQVSEIQAARQRG